MAFPECSLRAKRTWGFESKLESLAGFGLQIRSTLGACPVGRDVPTNETVRLYWVAADSGAREGTLPKRQRL